MPTHEHLEDYLRLKFWPGWLRIKPYGFDLRNNWNTQVVTNDGQVVGFMSGSFDEE